MNMKPHKTLAVLLFLFLSQSSSSDGHEHTFFFFVPDWRLPTPKFSGLNLIYVHPISYL